MAPEHEHHRARPDGARPVSDAGQRRERGGQLRGVHRGVRARHLRRRGHQHPGRGALVFPQHAPRQPGSRGAPQAYVDLRGSDEVLGGAHGFDPHLQHQGLHARETVRKDHDGLHGPAPGAAQHEHRRPGQGGEAHVQRAGPGRGRPSHRVGIRGRVRKRHQRVCRELRNQAPVVPQGNGRALERAQEHQLGRPAQETNQRRRLRRGRRRRKQECPFGGGFRLRSSSKSAPVSSQHSAAAAAAAGRVCRRKGGKNARRAAPLSHKSEGDDDAAWLCAPPPFLRFPTKSGRRRRGAEGVVA
mmetsp:Transcript_22239/g.37655  ORF Transcript_22239/g.37655 Transcript_22239/m.37655 type:complete len:300 (+) Transcript_22239:409-1308(+)